MKKNTNNILRNFCNILGTILAIIVNLIVALIPVVNITLGVLGFKSINKHEGFYFYNNIIWSTIFLFSGVYQVIIFNKIIFEAIWR